MLIQTCTLKFSDGRSITATVQARTDISQVPVHYAGSVELLPRSISTADPSYLVVFFENMAEELGAQLENKTEGQYERWPE